MSTIQLLHQHMVAGIAPALQRTKEGLEEMPICFQPLGCSGWVRLDVSQPSPSDGCRRRLRHWMDPCQKGSEKSRDRGDPDQALPWLCEGGIFLCPEVLCFPGGA